MLFNVTTKIDFENVTNMENVTQKLSMTPDDHNAPKASTVCRQMTKFGTIGLIPDIRHQCSLIAADL